MADSLLIAKVEWGTDDVKENEHNSLQGMLVSFIYTLYFIQHNIMINYFQTRMEQNKLQGI